MQLAADQRDARAARRGAASGLQPRGVDVEENRPGPAGRGGRSGGPSARAPSDGVAAGCGRSAARRSVTSRGRPGASRPRATVRPPRVTRQRTPARALAGERRARRGARRAPGRGRASARRAAGRIVRVGREPACRPRARGAGPKLQRREPACPAPAAAAGRTGPAGRRAVRRATAAAGPATPRARRRRARRVERVAGRAPGPGSRSTAGRRCRRAPCSRTRGARRCRPARAALDTPGTSGRGTSSGSARVEPLSRSPSRSAAQREPARRRLVPCISCFIE